MTGISWRRIHGGVCAVRPSFAATAESTSLFPRTAVTPLPSRSVDSVAAKAGWYARRGSPQNGGRKSRGSQLVRDGENRMATHRELQEHLTADGEPFQAERGVSVFRGGPRASVVFGLENGAAGSDRVGAMYAQSGKLAFAGRVLAEGGSIREAARRSGCSRVTVRKLRARLSVLGLDRRFALCGCGLSGSHRGWCRVRFAKSPRRQVTLRTMRTMRRAIALLREKEAPDA